MPADDVVEQAWSDIYPGQFVRWTTPSFVRRGTVVSVQRRSMRVRWPKGNETVIPDAKHYWVEHKAGNREYGLCIIKDLPGRKAEKKLAKKKKKRGEYQDFIPTAEAVSLFGVNGKELRRWLRNGKVRSFQDKGGNWMVSAQSLGRYLSEKR